MGSLWAAGLLVRLDGGLSRFPEGLVDPATRQPRPKVATPADGPVQPGGPRGGVPGSRAMPWGPRLEEGLGLPMS